MKVKVLDGLRGYAALMIVLAHFPQLTDTALGSYFKLALSASKIGYLGVDIFFVLSGFLITRILIKEKKEGRFSFKRFYLKRALRIFPIYYIVIILCGFIFTWTGIEYTSLYLSNYYFSFYDAPHPLRHTWSLAVEEHYYLFWPLLIYLVSLKNIVRYYPAVLILIILITYWITSSVFDGSTTDALIYRATHFRILSISIGSMFAFYEDRIWNLLKKKDLVFKLVLVFLGAYGLSIMIHKTFLVDFISQSFILLFLFSIVSATLFLLVLSLENKMNLVSSVFTNKVIVFMGKISYGVYLFHFPVFYFFEMTPGQLAGDSVSLSEFVLPLSLAFIIPIISYFLIEKPLLNYKDKLVHRT